MRQTTRLDNGLVEGGLKEGGLKDGGLSERLAHCYSGAVFDALRERGITNTLLPRDIRPLDDSTVLAGPVFTVEGSPKVTISADESLLSWTGFLAAAPAGHVVIANGNTDDLALMGELSAETLKGNGVLGYVTDGGCRDCAFIRSIEFPVYSRFFTPRDVVGVWSVDAMNAPIDIGGVKIAAGDYMIADIDGALIIPAAIAEEVVADVEEVANVENKVRDAIRSGIDPKTAYLQYGRF